MVQHLKTSLHQNKLSARTNKPRQQLLEESLQNTSSVQETFSKDLCNLFLGCNIPLHKLDNPIFQTFLKTYCNVENTKITVPSLSTLRKKYVGDIYTDVLEDIKKKIKDQNLWISVDETTDGKGRQVANLIVGVLNGVNYSKGHLISVSSLESTNHVTIARFVNEGLAKFFLPERVPSEKILLMVTDAASYMLKSAQSLKIFFPNLIHCTCLAHGLNRVAEKIRLEYPLVNSLISNIKKYF